MKKFITILLSLCVLLSCFALPVSADEVDWSGFDWEDIDDTDTDYCQYFSADGELHECGDWEDRDDAKDDLGAFCWFQGGHLFMSSGHFAYPGSYMILTFTGVKFEWHTQYRGPVGVYSSSAAIYLDDELVAEVGEEQLNGENLTNNWIIWESGLLENKEHVVKIVNTADPETESGQRLPFDCFRIYYPFGQADVQTEYKPETKAPETKAPETKAPETNAGTNAEGTNAPETKAPEAKKGCKSSLGMGAVVMLAVLAAPVVLKKKH